MDFRQEAQQRFEQLKENRRYLHTHPELSDQEEHTVAYICRKLKEYGLTEIIEVPKGGVLGIIHGQHPGKTVMLRADIDALPIQEPENNLTRKRLCRSSVPGVMHACGHDGHTSCLLTAADILQAHTDEFPGTVICCFERGEEAGEGVHHLLRYFKEKMPFDVCFGMHVEPAYPCGTFGISPGISNAGSLAVQFRISGRGGHASRPDLARSPVDVMLMMIQELQQIRMKNISPFEEFTLSINKITAGTQANVIPESAEFAGSARYFHPEVRQSFEQQVDRIIAGLQETYDVQIEDLGRSQGGALPLINDAEAAAIARETALAVVGEENLKPQAVTMGSESFPRYFAVAPGCYGNLGIASAESGAGAWVHNPQFDLDEGALVVGAAMHAGFAVNYLNSH